MIGSIPVLATTWTPAWAKRDSRREREAFDVLRRTLRSGNKWDRSRTVEALAKLSQEEAWRLVLEALSDPAGEVADVAQYALAHWNEEPGRSELASADGLKSRDEWTRLRAAEVFGRFECEVSSGPLLRAVGDSDARVRRMALWSIERAARAGRLAAAEVERLIPQLERRAAKDSDVGNRARALMALEALGCEQAAEFVRSWCEDKGRGSEARRTVAAYLAPRVLGLEEALDRLDRLAADDHRSARCSALRALATLRDPRALGILIERLGQEPELRLLGFIVDRLRAVSGFKHRADPRPWRDWLATLPEGWRAKEMSSVDMESGSSVGGGAGGAGATVAFAGLPILSRRLTFLIDLSGSMWTPAGDGRTRKEIVEEKLREALERMEPDTSFNLIPFTGRPRPWRKELVPATPRNVRSALDFFEGCTDRGTGNFWDAALLALEDPDVDTLVVLTDGIPTGGRRHLLELLVPLYVEDNLTRQVSVDSILVGASIRVQKHWARLAHETLGRTVAPEL